MGFNEKEFQTVILAALLHDIGKFMNRGKDVRRKHPYFSADYVVHDNFKKVLKDEWVDFDLLKYLVQRHHEYPQMPDDLLVQTIKDQHTRALAYIVSRADSYSSGERIEEEPSELDFKNARLASILTRVKKEKDNQDIRYYKLKRLSPEASFPVKEDELFQLTYDYDKLQEEFGKAFTKFKPKDFTSVINGYLSLFEEFMWCVPSDTRERYNDVSLYDHLSTTSAIAACLYQYHCDNFDEKTITNNNIENCMLVGGDLSGIQGFIFEIGSTNPKRLSKILRGRSFYLSLLTEVASLKILRYLNLPVSCRIMNAGGRFVLLVPNKNDVREKLIVLKNEIDRWFFERFLGKLSLNITWGVTLNKKGFTSGVFSEKQKELSTEMELLKRKKYETFIKEEQLLYNVLHQAHELLQKNEPCEFCKVYPALVKGDRCCVCKDSEEIGKSVVSENFIYFYEGRRDKVLEIMGYSISFEKLDDEWVLLEYIGDDNDIENLGYIKREISNYMPERQKGDIDFKKEKPSEGNTLCRYCGSPCKVEDDEKQEIPRREALVRTHLTFQCISASTRRENSGKGVDHLAVIKADVDDLGFVFGYGLGERLSISRYASLSRMLNYFFTGWLKHEIRINYRMAYTVYAGGDDLLLIAPWEDAILLGRGIDRNFKAYVGENSNISLSMGINLMRPNSPVRLAVGGAQENLDRSKEVPDKNSLTVFSVTVKWDKLDELMDFMNLLNGSFNEEGSKVNASFLYRLLKYHEMYLEFAQKDLIDGLRFHSLMARDVRRNIERRGKNGEILNPEIINALYPLYTIKKEDFNEFLMKNLKLPVFWVLYKNRGGT